MAKPFAFFPPEREQQIRLKRFLLAFGAYVMNVSAVLAARWMGYFTTQVIATYLSYVVLVNVSIFLLIRSGLNKRFSDPSLTAAQLVCATLSGLYLMYYADDFRAVFLMFGISMLGFGMFQFRPRDFTKVGAFLLSGYGCVIALLMLYRPNEIRLKVEVVQWIAMFVTLVQFGTLASYVGSLRRKLRVNNQELEKRNVELEAALQRISDMAIRDELTGVYNRRYLMDRIAEETYRCARNGTTFCVCVLDVDFFKRVNDRFGHMTGDLVLQRVAATASGTLRMSDTFGRFGGEEFVMLLIDTVAAGALVSAERVRQAVEQIAFQEIDPALKVTISIGIAEHVRGTDATQTFKNADDALYRAKETGRNRCVLAQTAEQTEA